MTSQTDSAPTGAARRRGPLRPGDQVQLTDPKGRMHTITLEPGRQFHTHKGILEHDALLGEVKSMRTSAGARGRGVATRLLVHLLDEARRRGYERVSLEIGTQPFFEPARRLYRQHGFVECEPFGDYRLDEHSVYLTLMV